MTRKHPFRLEMKPRIAALAIEKVLGLDGLAKMYDGRPAGLPKDMELDGFLHHILGCVGADFELMNPDNLAAIPKEGPVVIVCNHPLGGIEGMELTRVFAKVRPDLKVLTNKLLTEIPELADTFIGVNVLAENAAQENAKGIKQTCKHLKSGGALLVFPAGKVSEINVRKRCIEDQQWDRLVGMLTRRYKAKAIPCFVDARNSKAFYLAALVHPLLRTGMLAREMLNKEGASFKLFVGEAIEQQEIAHLESDDAVTQYLRVASYSLPNRALSRTQKKRPLIEELIQPPSQRDLPGLIDAIQELEQFALVSQRGFTTYCVPHKRMGIVMDELAWARERTFREVGEGSGKALDSDQFDPYYLHLFVWDGNTNRIVGGYRLGKVDEIVRERGLNALYSRSLYRFDESYIASYGKSLEVGRSFVSPEYQRHPRSLDMLWKGIGHFVAANAEYHTLFGCVSISREYSRLARAFLSDSLMANFRAEQAYLSDIRPIKPLKVKGKLWDERILAGLNDIAAIGKLVGRFDSGKSVPVLLRHYLALNGKFICFGVNESFSSSLDGLIKVDLRETPEKYLKRYMGKEGALAFMSGWEKNDAVA